ncbi:MAG: type II toxin-antitoxin system RelE/ParE family toxin [Verrucomicrobiota bacterium]
MKVIRRSTFDADFVELLEYFRDHAGDAVAWRFVEAVERLVKLIARHPKIGRERRDLKPPDIRSFVIREFRNYILFYRIEENTLVLLRLRYGGMNLSTLLN